MRRGGLFYLASSTPEETVLPSRTHHLDRRAAALAETGAGAGDPNDLLTTEQMAAWLGVSTQWLEIGRVKGYGPPFVRVGPKMIRYKRGDGIKWLGTRTHARTAEYRRRRSRGKRSEARV
jgi:hypothetical protein